MVVGQSGAAPGQGMPAPGQTGVGGRMIGGGKGRVYTAVNQRLGLRISVGDSIAVREGLVQAVIRSVLMPAAVMLPVLALLIWFATARGLAPLDQLAAGLRARGAGDLSPLPDGPTPQEIRPVRQALDALLARVRTHREHERDFIAFAAHELKTPLAGLKMQAQIALRVEDEETRRHALEVMERSVTRTDRAVRQLLELARVGQTEAGGTPARTGDVARSVVTELAFFAEARQVALRLVPGPDGEVADGLVLAVVLRNLVENAIRPFVIGRKNWRLSATVRGAESSANIYSLIETAKANGLEPYRYLCQVLAELIDDARLIQPFNLNHVGRYRRRSQVPTPAQWPDKG